jgi:hypothetical protein
MSTRGFKGKILLDKIIQREINQVEHFEEYGSKINKGIITALFPLFLPSA